MKYLKSYKLFELQISGFEESDIKSVFESCINWNLVRDVEEMSLDYIDNDMILNLEITYDKKYYIYFMRYDHSGSKSDWMTGSFNSLTEGPYELEPIDKTKIVYQFYLTKDEMIQKEADNELESRIKEAYPNENINPRLSFADVADEMIHSLFVGESIYESPLVIELKDMALELTDMGYNVQIFKDRQETDDNIRTIITHRDDLTMKTDVKEFLFRAISYMKDNGYKYDTHSNYGRLHFTEDGRIIISGGEARPNYPRFTMINILFKK
jgi:hypothetical protein